MTKIADCTAVILCGGQSSRMGFDKALLQVNHQYVLMKTFTALESLFEEVLLVTDDRRKFPTAFENCRILEDVYKNCGPLGGLVTALEAVHTPHIFLLACDMPQISHQLIRKMANYRSDHQVVICQHANLLEPLFAFYHHSCLAAFQQQLTRADWRLRQSFGQFSVKKLTSNGLINVNRPEELSRWQT